MILLACAFWPGAVAVSTADAPVEKIDVYIAFVRGGVAIQNEAQSINVKLVPQSPVPGVYVVFEVHSDFDVINMNSTDGWICHQFRTEPTEVACMTPLLDNAQSVGIHGAIRGPGDRGRYAIMRVGTMSNGSPGRGWVLNADYVPIGGTIPLQDMQPTGIDSGVEPTTSTVFLPIIEGREDESYQ